MSSKDLERRLTLLQRPWDDFHDTSTRVSEELDWAHAAGRSRDEIVSTSTPPSATTSGAGRDSPRGRRSPDSDELAAFREEYVDNIRAYNAEGKPARSWPIQFLIRRTAQHAMDHAWEMEDRDLTDDPS